MDDYLAIIIGGIIGFLAAFLSTFLLDYFRAKRELKKWKLESTHEYYRRLYDILAPFFSAPDKIFFAMVERTAHEILNLPKEEQQQISFNLDIVLNESMEALRNFIDKGYFGLFPSDLGLMMISFNARVKKLNKLIKDKGIQNGETLKTLDETMSIGKTIRERMRQLLNIDALG